MASCSFEHFYNLSRLLKMVQRMVEGQKFHEIEEYAIALSAFKEPVSRVTQNANFFSFLD